MFSHTRLSYEAPVVSARSSSPLCARHPKEESTGYRETSVPSTVGVHLENGASPPSRNNGGFAAIFYQRMQMWGRSCESEEEPEKHGCGSDGKYAATVGVIYLRTAVDLMETEAPAR